MKLLGPTRINAFQFLVPALAVVMAAIFLSEPIRPIQVVGGVIILAGVALLRRGSWPGRGAVRALGARAVTPGAAPLVPPLLPGEPPLAILVDYDGTIALTDVSDTVMAEYVTGDWEAEAAAYDAGLMGSRRLMTIEMAMVDSDPADLLATAAAQPHDPGFVPFVRRAQAAGIPVEIVSDGFGFFIEPALVALGVGELPVITARTTFSGRRAAIDYPNGHPTLPRVRDVQAQPRPRAPGGRSGRRVHRRRRESTGMPRATATSCGRSGRSSGSASRPAGRSIAGRSSREIEAWLADDARGLAGGSGVAARPAVASVLLRSGSLGRRPRRSAAGRVAAARFVAARVPWRTRLTHPPTVTVTHH